MATAFGAQHGNQAYTLLKWHWRVVEWLTEDLGRVPTYGGASLWLRFSASHASMITSVLASGWSKSAVRECAVCVCS